MGTFSDPIIGGGGDLIREEIRSPNFQSGVAGWRIAKDGSAEFLDALLRGELLIESPDGSYIRIFLEEPGNRVLIEIRPADGVGATIVPAEIRVGQDPGGRTALTLQGMDIDGGGSAEVYLSSEAGTNAVYAVANYIQLTSANTLRMESGLDFEFISSDPANSWFSTLAARVDHLLLEDYYVDAENAEWVLSLDRYTINDREVLRGERGTALISVSAATSDLQAVSFTVPFDVAPNVHVNFNSAPGAAANWHCRAINITTTGFTIFSFGPSNTFSNVPIGWTAVVGDA